MHRIFFTVLLLWIACVSGASAAIDQKLLDGDVGYYQNVLKKLDDNQSGDPLQISLQKALLQRLILISEHPPSRSRDFQTLLKSSPDNAETYRAYFHTLLDAAAYLSSAREKADRLKREAEVLKKELLNGGAPTHKKNPQTLQLQYAYSLLQERAYEGESQAVKKQFDAVADHFSRLVDQSRIDPAAIRNDLTDLRRKLQGLHSSAEDLRLEKERLTILGHQEEEIRQLDRGLESLRKATRTLRNREAEDLFLLFVHELKRKDRHAFETAKELTNVLRGLGLPEETLQRLDDLLLAISQKRFGIAATLRSAAGQEVRHTLHFVWEQANAPIFTINGTPITPLKILVTLIIFILGFLIGYLYKRAIQGINTHNFTEATKTLLANMGYYLIIIIAFFVALHFLGINLSSIALVAGALSVGIGFGLQNIVSNFISGIILMFERSIKIGDYIELGEDLKGRVTDVRMRSLTITTNANIDIIVPNQELIQNRVINWTMNDKIRRFEIPFSVAYGTEVNRVISVVLEAVGRSGYEDIINARDRQTQVIMTGMGDSGVDFKLFVWIKGPKTLTPQRTTSRFLILIYNALYEAGIEIPFPQRDLHIRSVSEPLPVVLQHREQHDAGDTPPPDLSRS